MKVSYCEKCKCYERRKWSDYINPDGRYASKPEITFTMDTVTKAEDTACKIHKDDTWYKNRCYGIKGDDDNADKYYKFCPTCGRLVKWND